MTIVLSTRMLDLLMPYSRQYKLTPAKALLQILEQQVSKDDINNGKEETQQN